MSDEQGDVETLPAGAVLDGKFRIVRCIGIGGMGAVYEIHHELTRHRRALKLLHPQLSRDRDAVERFLREASAAGRIDNPHIVETFDAGWLSSGDPYLVMEFLEGRGLDECLAQAGALPTDEALAIVAQACRGVDAAHRAGIIHRDLKPENLFVLEREGEPFVKLLDFGIGKFEDARVVSRATQEGAFIGTPYYMSPEQFLDGRKVDARSDIYSLGVILFECITGKHPYPCETLAHLASKIMVEEPPAPSSVRPGIHAAIDTILRRALQKAPDARFASAEAMATEIERLIRDGNLTLPQGSSWQSQYPAGRQVREARAGAEKTVRAEAAETVVATLPSERPEAATTEDSPLVVGRRPRWPLFAAGIAAAATVAVIVAVQSSSSPGPDAAESAPPRETAEPPPVPSTTQQAPTRPAAPSVETAPSASPSAPLPRAPQAAPKAKPDFATEEEFPD